VLDRVREAQQHRALGHHPGEKSGRFCLFAEFPERHIAGSVSQDRRAFTADLAGARLSRSDAHPNLGVRAALISTVRTQVRARRGDIVRSGGREPRR
jgi:hypothetical protein